MYLVLENIEGDEDPSGKSLVVLLFDSFYANPLIY